MQNALMGYTGCCTTLPDAARLTLHRCSRRQLRRSVTVAGHCLFTPAPRAEELQQENSENLGGGQVTAGKPALTRLEAAAACARQLKPSRWCAQCTCHLLVRTKRSVSSLCDARSVSSALWYAVSVAAAPWLCACVRKCGLCMTSVCVTRGRAQLKVIQLNAQEPRHTNRGGNLLI